jgi:glyoxylase-like metal-dependent hydrolase (beta-lactamase superfamily II)
LNYPLPVRMNHPLPSGVQVFERGWLSANNVLLTGGAGPVALIDSGYCTHADQTLALVESALEGTSARATTNITLELLVNTHLHSDHCGGNAALQARYPELATLIPPGESVAVQDWDDAALSYAATGQRCPRFGFTGLLQAGATIRLGALAWEIHAAPGHDTHAVLLFEPISRTLVSGDALWADGFGVVFPELDGIDAFNDVAATLDLIEALAPRLVIPGHGPVFSTVDEALITARRRLRAFEREPLRHARHAAKVLLKFKLLEWQQQEIASLLDWAETTPLLRALHARHFSATPPDVWAADVLAQLKTVGAAEQIGTTVFSR